MKVIFFSDTHGRHEQVIVPNGDLLLFAGDMSFAHSSYDIIAFNDWLGTLPHKYKLITAGNHDLFLTDEENRRFITNADLVIHQTVEVEGIKFFISPFSRRFSDRGAFALSSAAMAKQTWEEIPIDVDVLVTHGPPQGILDIDETVTGNKPQGCPILRDWVEAYKPSVHIFGHIHKSHGALQSQHTRFYNCSIASGSNHEEFDNTPMMFEIR